MVQQCQDNEIVLGNIADENSFNKNLAENAIPKSVISMDYTSYDKFLIERRQLMAQMIKEYYQKL